MRDGVCDQNYYKATSRVIKTNKLVKLKVPKEQVKREPRDLLNTLRSDCVGNQLDFFFLCYFSSCRVEFNKILSEHWINVLEVVKPHKPNRNESSIGDCIELSFRFGLYLTSVKNKKWHRNIELSVLNTRH